ncbi:MAG: RNA-binding protein [Flavobacteriaceae bacterium]|nr:MAG: RNA-binding protein [Flavobacteriaceae bacterium]
MRVDKYLWAIRFFKTRTLASDACKKNKILVDDKPVKASKEILPSQIIQINKNQIKFKVKVIEIPKSRVGAKLVSLYALDLTPKEELDKLNQKLDVLSVFREKGTGRPTKRERRDLEDYLDDHFDD